MGLMQTTMDEVMSVSIKVQDKQLRNAHHMQVCDLSYIHRNVELTIVIDGQEYILLYKFTFFIRSHPKSQRD